MATSLTPDSYFTPYKGQSLLYPGQSTAVKGQCVQSVMLWLKATGTTPPIYEYAKDYYTRGIIGYSQVAASTVPQPADIAVWSGSLAGSGGAGHISVVASANGVKDFYSWDSNWQPPYELNKIHHNGSEQSNLLGYLRKATMEIFNEGDRFNFNMILYGADKGFHKDLIGKEFKAAMYLLKDSSDFRAWQYLNSGDFFNHVGHQPTTAEKQEFGMDGSGIGTMTHKDAWYKLQQEGKLSGLTPTNLAAGIYKVN